VTTANPVRRYAEGQTSTPLTLSLAVTFDPPLNWQAPPVEKKQRSATAIHSAVVHDADASFGGTVSYCPANEDLYLGIVVEESNHFKGKNR
jgi:hypothetical protein